MSPRLAPFLAAMAFALLAASLAQADVFNMSGGQTSLDFVTVGDPGNAPDTTGLGAVSYTYSIGKFDVTAAQYVEFLNAVAKTDPYGLYTPSMAGSADCNIQRSGAPGSYSYSVDPQWANRPVNYVSFGDAARFCNWLQNGEPSRAEGNGTTESGAYTLNGATTNSALLAITRNATATYFIPSENEWYKAAYYKGGGTQRGLLALPDAERHGSDRRGSSRTR